MIQVKGLISKKLFFIVFCFLSTLLFIIFVIVDSFEIFFINPLGCDSIFSGRAHNCFTWARDKLRKMGVELGWVAFGFIATEPKSFTHPNEYYKKIPSYKKYSYDNRIKNSVIIKF